MAKCAGAAKTATVPPHHNHIPPASHQPASLPRPIAPMSISHIPAKTATAFLFHGALARALARLQPVRPVRRPLMAAFPHVPADHPPYPPRQNLRFRQKRQCFSLAPISLRAPLSPSVPLRALRALRALCGATLVFRQSRQPLTHAAFLTYDCSHQACMRSLRHQTCPCRLRPPS